MERKPKRLSVQSLSQDDALRDTVGEVPADEWLRADALRRDLRWAALDGNDPWALYQRISNDINNNTRT